MLSSAQPTDFTGGRGEERASASGAGFGPQRQQHRGANLAGLAASVGSRASAGTSVSTGSPASAGTSVSTGSPASAASAASAARRFWPPQLPRQPHRLRPVRGGGLCSFTVAAVRTNTVKNCIWLLLVGLAAGAGLPPAPGSMSDVSPRSKQNAEWRCCARSRMTCPALWRYLPPVQPDIVH